jgi:N-acetyltransferase
MSNNDAALPTFNWRIELPVLTGRVVTLREPGPGDSGALFDLLSLPDATRFDREGSFGPGAVKRLIDRAARDRAAGVAFTYVIAFAATSDIVGLIQVRQLDPTFEIAAWDCTLAPQARGTGAFVDAARLVGSFAFASAGASRLEARVDVDNSRATGALRKLGAVEEGILRRSARRGHGFVDQRLWAVLKDTWEYCATPQVVTVH